MTEIQKDNKSVRKVPNLRFPEFAEEWESKKLGEVMDFKVTNSFSRENLNYEIGTVKNIHYGDIHTKFQTLFDITKEVVPFINEEINLDRISDENYCIEGDIIFADASEDLNDVGKSIEVVNVNGEKLLSGLHTLLGRPKTSIFHLGFNGYLFKSNFVRTQIQMESQGSKVLSINVGRISKIDLSFPAVDEQQKITSFFALLDDRIHTQNKIIKELNVLKTTIAKRIFSGQLRFKDDNGNNFSKWEEKKLKQIASIQMGQSPDSSSYNIENIGVPLIQGNADIVNRKSYPRQYTSKPTKISDIGDILLTVRAPVGYVAKSYQKNCIGRGVCSIKNNEKSTNEFIYQFLLYFEDKWKALEQGSTFTAVSGSDINSISLKLPCITEQTKIANFLSSIDSKIDIETQLLQKLEEQKKFLLHNIFA